MSKKVRSKVVLFLNIIKFIIISMGAIISLFSALCVDSEGDIGLYFYKLCVFGIVLLITGIFIEIFIVTKLVKNNEYVNTIFDFNFYGLRSKKNHDEYKLNMNCRKMCDYRNTL